MGFDQNVPSRPTDEVGESAGPGLSHASCVRFGTYSAILSPSILGACSELTISTPR